MKEPGPTKSARSRGNVVGGSGPYSFERCIELSKSEIVRAAQSSAQCRSLLSHLASIARPNDGAPLVLLLFARLGSTACDWLDGDLHIALEADGASTVITVATDLGSGFCEKVFPTFVLRVPLDEFTRAVRRIPQMVLPLRAEMSRDRLLLTATERVRTRASAPDLADGSALATQWFRPGSQP